jgi:4-O-beta-D-mannosyl-D-glucose phosphorylase
VATSTIDQLLDYVMNTPKDRLTSAASVETLKSVIDKNLQNEEKSKKAAKKKLHV